MSLDITGHLIGSRHGPWSLDAFPATTGTVMRVRVVHQRFVPGEDRVLRPAPGDRELADVDAIPRWFTSPEGLARVGSPEPVVRRSGVVIYVATSPRWFATELPTTAP